MNAGIRLVALSFEEVELHVSSDDLDRLVSVRVASGKTWLQACRYPHVLDESGETTGDDQLDHAIIVRAAEELIRLEAAVDSARARYVA